MLFNCSNEHPNSRLEILPTVFVLHPEAGFTLSAKLEAGTSCLGPYKSKREVTHPPLSVRAPARGGIDNDFFRKPTSPELMTMVLMRILNIHAA
jgi:hypothetical protein